ncbi:MAG: septum formation initiator family protein [Bacteroidia bacterium]
MLSLFKTYFQRIRHYAGTKYFLVLAFTGVWMLFFDRYNLVSQYQMKQQLETVERDRTHYREALRLIEAEQQKMGSDTEALENYAREKYQMKRANEDVYVIVRE